MINIVYTCLYIIKSGTFFITAFSLRFYFSIPLVAIEEFLRPIIYYYYYLCATIMFGE